MASTIVMPRLSDTMTEGKILKWHKKEGEAVKSGDPVADVETDKATLELECYEDGTLLKIVVPEGSSAPLGATVAVVGKPGEDISALLAAQPAAAPAPKAAEKPAEPEKPAPVASRAADETRHEVRELPRVATPPSAPAPSGEGGRVKASPLARRMARESGVDLARVSGTGPAGRIVARDLQGLRVAPEVPAPAMAPGGPAPAARAAPTAAAAPAPTAFFAFPPAPEPGLHDLTGMRQVIATRTGQAWREVPHFFLTADVDMEACMSLRAELKELGVPLSVNDFLLKAAALGLLKVPDVNRSFEGGRFRQHESADVGMAVALPDGLITPVVREADRLSLAQIGAIARDLAERARTKRLKPEEYAGGSVTVSNLGMFGVDSFYAVINPPQAAILAAGRVAERPVVHEERIVARQRMYLSLSGDHRVIDGAFGARYLAAVKEALERPAALLV